MSSSLHLQQCPTCLVHLIQLKFQIVISLKIVVGYGIIDSSSCIYIYIITIINLHRNVIFFPYWLKAMHN